MNASLAMAALFAAALATPAAAAPGALEDLSGGAGNRYEQCAALAKSNAQNAYNQALAWHSAGGGISAEHCEALALTQLGRYAEAAPLLDSLAQDTSLQPSARSQLWDQAGNVWLLAEQAAKAESSFSNALELSPNEVDLLADRARARAMRQNWAGAEADLSAALVKDSNRADLYVLRASARHAEGRKAQARADIDQALDIFPGYGDALVERGVMEFEDGDDRAAKADWRSVVNAAPRSRAAALAGEYLSQTDSSQN
jgi:tetratricopeptide (TPR) repeat protein